MTNGLLDHLVGAGMERDRDVDAKRSRRLEVDDQFERGRLHHGQFGRFGSRKNPAGVDAGSPIRIRDTRAIAD